jgi:hypothetical protein
MYNVLPPHRPNWSSNTEKRLFLGFLFASFAAAPLTGLLALPRVSAGDAPPSIFATFVSHLPSVVVNAARSFGAEPVGEDDECEDLLAPG